MLVVSGEGCNAAHTEGTESKFKLAGPQGWLPKLIVNCNISNQLYLFKPLQKLSTHPFPSWLKEKVNSFRRLLFWQRLLLVAFDLLFCPLDQVLDGPVLLGRKTVPLAPVQTFQTKMLVMIILFCLYRMLASYMILCFIMRSCNALQSPLPFLLSPNFRSGYIRLPAIMCRAFFLKFNCQL